MSEGIRKFVHSTGFKDSTDFIYFENGRGHAVTRTGQSIQIPTTLDRALKFVENGDWIEVKS